MKRINIEVSAALGRWIDQRRQNLDLYVRLVSRALELLPVTPRRVRGYSERAVFFAIAAKLDSTDVLTGVSGKGADRRRRQVEEHPSRVFANALANYAWRNQAVVEDLHAGWPGDSAYPLTRRRIRVPEEREVMRKVVLGMMEGVAALNHFEQEGSRSWEQFVLPYNFAHMLLVTPSDWDLTEETCEFREIVSPAGEN
jgi:hypothetical protein